MTSVYYNELGENRCEVEIDGHAGFSVGNDIVCSACSILAYQLLNELKEMQEDGDVLILSEIDEDGYFFVSVENLDAGEKLEHILHMTMTGYALLESQYPDYVRLMM